jgi:hypothetical protein
VYTRNEPVGILARAGLLKERRGSRGNASPPTTRLSPGQVALSHSQPLSELLGTVLNSSQLPPSSRRSVLPLIYFRISSRFVLSRSVLVARRALSDSLLSLPANAPT